MALSFGSVGAFANANNASVTPTLPSGTTGDLILLLAYGRGSGTLNCPVGYLAAYNVQYTNTATSTQALFYRVSDGSEGNPTVTYTGGSAGDDVIASIVRVTGADGVTPIKQVGAGSANGTAANIGAITAMTIQTNNAVVVMGGKRSTWTSVGTLSTSGGFTYTEIDDTSKSSSGSGAGMVWDFSILAGAAASTGAKTFTVTGGSNNPGGGNMVEIQVAQTLAPFKPVFIPNPILRVPYYGDRTFIDQHSNDTLQPIVPTVYGAAGQAPTYDFPIPVINRAGLARQALAGRSMMDVVPNDNLAYLIGQDIMYDGPGQVPTYDWTNPTAILTPILRRKYLSTWSGYDVRPTLLTNPLHTRYADAVLTTPGLLDYFRLGESSGNIANNTARPNNYGQYGDPPNNPTLGVTGAIYADGDTAVRNDGVNHQFVFIPVDLTETNVISIEMWAIWDAFSNNQAAIWNNQGDFFMQPNAADGSFTLTGHCNAGADTATYTRPTAGAYHHYVAVYDLNQTGSNRVKFYIDGALQTQLSGSFSSGAGSTDNFELGAFNTYIMPHPAGNQAACTVDELALYNVALTQAQVLNHYMIGWNPSLFGNDGFRSFEWIVPNGAPPHRNNRMWTDGHLTNTLKGQDSIYNGPGQAPLYDWTNPSAILSPIKQRRYLASFTDYDIKPTLLTTLLYPPYAKAVLSTAGLYAYWRLDEKAANIFHDIFGGHDGTTSGTTFGVTGAIYNDDDTAFNLNNGNISSSNVNLNSVNTVSLEMWVSAASGITGTKLFGVGNDFGDHFSISLDSPSAEQLTVEIVEGVNTDTATYIKPTNGYYHYYVVVYDRSQSGANRIKVYVDGALQTAISTSMSTVATNFTWFTDVLFNGKRTVDDAALYTVALSQATVLSHYMIGANPPLMGYDGFKSYETPTPRGPVISNAILTCIQSYMTTMSAVQESQPSGIFLDWPNPIRIQVPRMANRVFIDQHSLDVLFGQDQMYNGSGQVPTYDWPTRLRVQRPNDNMTWLQNLLEQSLAPQPEGTFLDWPNPLPRISYRGNRGWADEHSLDVLLGQDKIYNGPGQVPAYDWQLPPRGATPYRDNRLWIVSHLNDVLFGQDAMYGAPGEVPTYDWPTRLRLLWSNNNRTWTQNQLEGLQAPQPEGTILSWPNPLLRAAYRGNGSWIDQHSLDVLYGQDKIYNGPGQVPAYDWQLPPRGATPYRDNRLWVVSHLNDVLFGQDSIYGAPGEVPTYDYPTRLRLLWSNDNRTWIQNQLEGLHAPQPYGVFVDWPNPIPRAAYRSNRGWTDQHNLDVLFGQDKIYAGPGQVPNYDWIVPKGYARANELNTWVTQGLPIDSFLFDVLPIGEQTWPDTTLDIASKARLANALRTMVEDRGDSTLIYLLGQDSLYGAPGQAPTYDWQLPVRRIRTHYDLVQNILDNLYVPLTLPDGTVVDYPNPLRRAPHRENRTWLQNLVEQSLAPQPEGTTYHWPNPVLRVVQRDSNVWTCSLVSQTLQPMPDGKIENQYLPQRMRLRKDIDFANILESLLAELQPFGIPNTPYDRKRPYFPRLWIDGDPLNLCTLAGQESIYGAPGEVPVYEWTVPKGYARASTLRTYTDDPLGLLTLLGQDTIYGDPGEVPVYEWVVPPGYAPSRYNRTYLTWAHIPNPPIEPWHIFHGHRRVLFMVLGGRLVPFAAQGRDAMFHVLGTRDEVFTATRTPRFRTPVR